jgi:hypothetical protein
MFIRLTALLFNKAGQLLAKVAVGWLVTEKSRRGVCSSFL